MDRRSLPLALGVVLLALAVKALLVLSLADVFFYGEELEKGTAAKAMLDGLSVPHHTLAYHYYEGGGFLVSHLTALAFLGVGENLLAHKLVSLGFNAAIVLIGFAVCRRSFGLLSAVVFGLLFTFAPAGIQKVSLLNLGIHYESLLFVLLLLGQAAAFLRSDEETNPRAVFLFGLTAGFGTFFSYQMVPLMAYLLGVLLLFRRSFFGGKRPLAFVGGGLVGALPLILMFAAVGMEVFNIHGTALIGSEEAADAEKPSGIANALYFVYSLLVGGTPLEHLRFLAAVLLPFWGLSRLRDEGDLLTARRAPFLLFFGYGLFYALVYVNSSFVVRVAYHHFMLQRTTPFWMVALVLGSAVLGALLASRELKWRALGGVAALVMVANGVFGTVQTVNEGRPGPWAENLELLQTAKGYTYAEYLAKFFKHFEEKEHPELLAIAMEFDEPDRSLLRAEASTALYAKSPLSPDEILAAFQEVDPEAWRDFIPGLGQFFFRRGANNMEIALRIVLRLDTPHRTAFLEALGRRGIAMRTQPEALDAELVSLEGSQLPLAYYRGLGHRVFESFRLDPEGAAKYMSTVPAAYQTPVTKGYEAAREERTFSSPEESRRGGRSRGESSNDEGSRP